MISNVPVSLLLNRYGTACLLYSNPARSDYRFSLRVVLSSLFLEYTTVYPTMTRFFLLSVLFFLEMSSLSSAFVPQQQKTRPTIELRASKPFHLEAKIIAASAFVMSNAPLIVRAVVEDDNYEYGAVDAPIGIAVGGGILAILTALLPIALRSGEEAFEEIKDREQSSFGKKNSDVLNKKK